MRLGYCAQKCMVYVMVECFKIWVWHTSLVLSNTHCHTVVCSSSQLSAKEFLLVRLQSEHENCSEIFVEIISQTIEIRNIREKFVLYDFPNYAHSAELPVVLETLLACYILASLAMCFIHDPVIWPSVSNLVSFCLLKIPHARFFLQIL